MKHLLSPDDLAQKTGDLKTFVTLNYKIKSKERQAHKVFSEVQEAYLG